MILGTDAAGVTADGREVVVHGVIGGASGHGVGPDEPRSLLSERYPGTLAEQVAVPTWNLVDKPAELSFVEAACLPTAWLTAYRMLFRSGGATPGQRVLVQGAGGGLATAAILLGAAAGLEVIVTSRVRGAPGARADARCRRRGGARGARAAGRRGAGERRQGHLVALGPVGAAGRDHRRRRRDQRGRRTGRADADLLPGDHRRRHHHGDARRPRAPARVPRPDRGATAGRLDVRAGRRARRRAAARRTATSSARSCSSLDGRRVGRRTSSGPTTGCGRSCCSPTTRATSSRAWSGTRRRRTEPLRPSRAILYVHGWSDYFFQTGLAEYWHARGAAFYALDLRKYGRSLRPGQTPGYVDDLETYDEEIEASLDVITADLGARARVMVMGHSTGGLVAALWANRHPGRAQRPGAQQPVARAAGVVGAAAPSAPRRSRGSPGSSRRRRCPTSTPATTPAP